MSILDTARNLRKNQTKEEKIMWNLLRNRQLPGLKFRRQHPISQNYIVDFYCAEKKLVIEIDGGIHSTPDVIQADKLRQSNISELGYHFLRFTNEQVNADLGSVLVTIAKKLQSL